MSFVKFAAHKDIEYKIQVSSQAKANAAHLVCWHYVLTLTATILMEAKADDNMREMARLL